MSNLDTILSLISIFCLYYTAPCGKGFYYNGDDDVKKCVPCPISQYQNLEAQLDCKPCMENTTTYQMGASSSDQCIGMLLSNPKYFNPISHAIRIIS